MLSETKELKKIVEELRIIFGDKQVAKIWSHLMSIHRKVEDLEKSRDLWKKKCMGLKKC